MGDLEYRSIPNYENYGVTEDGIIKSIPRDLIISQYEFNGYLIVDTFRGSATETLPVHRAVALAWVDNPEPLLFNIVNHKDGNKLNNSRENLEWTNHSGNNYHAVNTGLRSDNIRCKLRDFETGLIVNLASISQASAYMGLRCGASIPTLLPKKFGSLLADRYEFKFEDDHSPWFYETRDSKIPPSRYMVTVTDEVGYSREIYSTRVLLKEFQLYQRIYGGTIPELVEYAKEKFPNLVFSVRDSYTEEKFRVRSTANRNPALSVEAWKGNLMRRFPSVTQAAEYFGVDRSSIYRRLDEDICLDGWSFTSLPS